MIAVAENALKTHPCLEKVILLEHTPRFDLFEADPTGLKQKLAGFANTTLNNLITNSSMNKKITLGKHSMYPDADHGLSGRYDGEHMFGNQGKEEFTRSFLQIMRDALPTSTPRDSYHSSYHSRCPQALYQEKQQMKAEESKYQNHFLYNIPVRNQFNLLRN